MRDLRYVSLCVIHVSTDAIMHVLSRVMNGNSRLFGAPACYSRLGLGFVCVADWFHVSHLCHTLRQIG